MAIFKLSTPDDEMYSEPPASYRPRWFLQRARRALKEQEQAAARKKQSGQGELRRKPSPE